MNEVLKMGKVASKITSAPAMSGETRDAYVQLVELLTTNAVEYQVIHHPPEGRTELVSAMRGHSPDAAAKCMVMMVKVGRKVTKYVLGVVPGDRRLDLLAVKTLMGGTYIAMASPQKVEELAGSVIGTVLPFSFHADLEVVVDPSLLTQDRIYFNAARLDRSFVLPTAEYVRVAKPRVAVIASPEHARGDDV
jgi:Ala-tRNA(Pro) deacylase